MRRFVGPPSSTEMKCFFLEDADLELIEPKRRAPNRLGFAVLLTSSRISGWSWTT